MTPPQGSVSDVERLRAAAGGLLAFTTHNVACALYWDRYGSKEPSCTCGLEAARTELSAALTIPINKIGEDDLAEAVRNAEIVTREDSDNGWAAIKQSTLRTLLTAIRRLSTSTDKGVR